MYDRFTDRARKVMGFSRQEAQRYNHDYIGTEHVLLGLVDEGSGVAADVFRSLDVDPKRIRTKVEARIKHGTTMVTMGQLPFTKPTKRMLELALEEASNLGHNYIGTEHLLLGLIREGDGVAAQVLVELGVRCGDVLSGIRDVHGLARPTLTEDRFRLAQPASGPGPSFDQFTDRVRRVMGISWREARSLGHDYIGTEHILLGLLDDDGVVGEVFKAMRIDLKAVREEVMTRLCAGPEPIEEKQLPFTPRAKEVLGLAREEAGLLGHDYIGTEHLLLGLIREGEGIGGQVLRTLNLRLEDTRAQIRDLLADGWVLESPRGYDRLSGRARQAMKLARQEAQRLRHERIGPVHILLGILEEEIRTGPELSRLLIYRIRAEAEKLTAPGDAPVKGTLLFTPDAEAVLERAFQEAHDLGHARVATVHLLLALLHESGSIPARLLSVAGIRREAVLAEARRLPHGNLPPTAGPRSPPG